MADPDLELIGRLVETLLTEVREMRREHHDMLRLLNHHTDRFDRTDRRFTEVKDDLEAMIRAELMGRLAHFETRQEQKTETYVEDLVRELARRVEALETSAK